MMCHGLCITPYPSLSLPLPQLHCCYGIKNTRIDAASDAAMVTYIGGLHSPPVSQPTAIHQDIQLGEEEGTG